MNKWKLLTLSFGILSFTWLASPTGFAYETAATSNLSSSPRSPFYTQQTLDSDIRLRGMGFLTLPIQDDSNLIGIFKYGDVSAGLPLDYKGQRKAELGYWYESGNTKLDGEKFFDFSEGAISGMGALHFNTGNAGEGAFAFGFQSNSDMWDYSGSTLENKPTQGIYQAGYGHRFGDLIAGIGYRSIDAQTTKQNNGVKEKNESTEIDPSIGYVFHPATDQDLTVVASPRITTQKTTITDPFMGEDVYDLDGTPVEGGINYVIGSQFRTGLFVTSGKIDGDIKVDGIKLLTDKEKSTTMNWRAFFQPTGSRLSYGALLETSDDLVTWKDLSSATVLDHQLTSLTFGGGTALHLGVDRGLIGAEVRYLSDENKDKLAGGLSDKDSGYQISVGGEYEIVPPFIVRAGVQSKKLTFTQTGNPDQDATYMNLTLGTEWRINKMGSVALNYINGQSESKQVVPAFISKEQFSANSLQVVGRLNFGGASSSEKPSK